MKLMIPGPADVAPEDLLEMAQPVIPHYGTRFLHLWKSVRDQIKTIIGTTSELIIVPGAGTAGTEMALCGFAKHKCIVIISGEFSKRISEILKAHRANVIEIFVPDREPAMPELVREVLCNHPDAVAVCMVHSETSTGMLHPIAEIAKVVHETKALFVVDAVSSIGAVEFHMNEWGIDVCWSASQKAIGGPPGLAFVAISEKAFNFFEYNASEISSWYLNPLIWKQYIEKLKWHPYPTSLPTQVFASLDRILAKIMSIGLKERYRKQAHAAKAFRAGCKLIGFELYVRDENYASPTVTALIIPNNLKEQEFREALVENHSIMIAGGFGELRGKVIRVGHIGLGIECNYILSALKAMQKESIRLNLFGKNNNNVNKKEINFTYEFWEKFD